MSSRSIPTGASKKATRDSRVLGPVQTGLIQAGMIQTGLLHAGMTATSGEREPGGWIRVMGFDVVNAMVFYTLTTVAFYLLGAGVLRGMGVMPQGSEMVDTLSNMYTETLGGWSRYIFLPGAVAVFYSTVFAGTAARGRMMADILALLGAYDKKNYALRLTYTRLFIVFFLLVPTAFSLFVEEPVLMVKIAGLTEAMLLPVVAFSTVYLRYRHLPKAILPKGWITLALWLTSAVMLVMTTFSILQQLGTF